MAQKLMGRKRGMTQRFDDTGNVVVCTVVEAQPNVVTQVKTLERDGYEAVQTSFEEVKAKDERTVVRRVGKPLMGHFKAVNQAPRRFITESRLKHQGEVEVGATISVSLFEKGQFVDVRGTSKGKGFQGLMKKNNFSGGPAAHGSGFHRHAGSTGNRSTPGRCFPGSPRPSQMGGEQCTVQNLFIFDLDDKENLIFLKGCVPGPTGALVTLSAAKKKG